MKLDLSFTITAIIAIIALISPIATAFINNRHQIKLKKLEYKKQNYDNEYNHVRNLCESFLGHCGMISYSYENHIEELLSAYYVLTPYIPADEMTYFRQFSNLISEDASGARQASDTVLKTLFHDKIVPCLKGVLANLEMR